MARLWILPFPFPHNERDMISTHDFTYTTYMHLMTTTNDAKRRKTTRHAPPHGTAHNILTAARPPSCTQYFRFFGALAGSSGVNLLGFEANSSTSATYTTAAPAH